MNKPTEHTNADNPFEKGLMDRLPSELRSSFSSEQIAALEIAFGARKWGKHSVDLRGTFNVWRSRFYFVVLLGRNQRQLSQREVRISLMVKSLLLTTFIGFSTLLGLLVLYLLKSAAGIDIFPGFSLGIWGWFKGVFL